MTSSTTTQLNSLLPTYRDGLLNDVIPFWMKHAFDKQFGGIMTSLDERGQIIDTDKSVWAQGRTAWMFGELYNHPLCALYADRERWLELSTATCQFITDHCFDEIDGRMWFHVTREGQPIRKRRYSYSESFAAIAFGELAKATQIDSYGLQAGKLLNSFIEAGKNPDPANAKFTETRPTRSIGFLMIAMVTAQELRSSIQLNSANEIIDWCIKEIKDYFVKPDIQCVMETVASDGELLDHFDGRTLNPGHAIEAAWFIMEEGRARGDKQLVELGTMMLDWMWERGWDREFGGLLYFVSVDEKPIQEYWHDMKFWWTHNETIIATLLAFELTSDPKYLDWHRQVHEWTHQHFPDPENGEWFGYLRRDGTVSHRLKGNLWKGPFHIPRMQLKCWEIIDRISKKH